MSLEPLSKWRPAWRFYTSHSLRELRGTKTLKLNCFKVRYSKVRYIFRYKPFNISDQNYYVCVYLYVCIVSLSQNKVLQNVYLLNSKCIALILILTTFTFFIPLFLIPLSPSLISLLPSHPSHSYNIHTLYPHYHSLPPIHILPTDQHRIKQVIERRQPMIN